MEQYSVISVGSEGISSRGLFSSREDAQKFVDGCIEKNCVFRIEKCKIFFSSVQNPDAKEGIECLICSVVYENTFTHFVKLKCDHSLCTSCYYNIKQTGPVKCPFCRDSNLQLLRSVPNNI